MSYCSNCGARVKDNGICPNCGSVSESKIKSEQKTYTEVLICFRSFFSARPLSAIENAALTKSSPVWISFGFLFVVSCVTFILKALTSLDVNAAAITSSDKLANVIAKVSADTSPQMMGNFVALTTYATVMAICTFFILGCITLVMFRFAVEKPKFSQAMNITAVSLFPLSLSLLISLILSFISLPLAGLVITTGALMSTICYYFGVQKVSAFSQSPFWLFCGAFFAGGIILMILSTALFFILF